MSTVQNNSINYAYIGMNLVPKWVYSGGGVVTVTSVYILSINNIYLSHSSTRVAEGTVFRKHAVYLAFAHIKLYTSILFHKNKNSLFLDCSFWAVTITNNTKGSMSLLFLSIFYN